LPIYGFFFGLSFGAHSVQALFGDGFLSTTTSWVVGFFVGLLFAVLSYFFWYAVVLIAAGVLGVLLVGSMLAPLFAVQVGMGENILILAFVIIVIGGIGSIRGALVGAVLVGVVDTIGRAFLPILLGAFFQPRVASAAGPALASVMIYLIMAIVLYFRPQGLFPARG